MATISLSKRSIEKNETVLKNRCACQWQEHVFLTICLTLLLKHLMLLKDISARIKNFQFMFFLLSLLLNHTSAFLSLYNLDIRNKINSTKYIIFFLTVLQKLLLACCVRENPVTDSHMDFWINIVSSPNLVKKPDFNYVLQVHMPQPTCSNPISTKYSMYFTVLPFFT
jgi:hypothetical protein